MSTAQIHPSAVVDPSAQLGAHVQVGAHVVIEAEVQVAEGTLLLPGTILQRGARIGARCRLGPYAVVAGEPMDSAFAGETSVAVLEDEVVLRDFATVHRASGAGAETRVGAGSLLMSYVHVSHNVQVGRACVLTTHVQLGGHSRVEDYAVLGANAMLHQHARVGAYAMVAALSGVLSDVLPFSLAQGRPVKHYRLNRVGLQRRGIVGERYAWLEQAIRAFRRDDRASLQALAAQSPDVQRMLTFEANSRRGLSRFVGR